MYISAQPTPNMREVLVWERTKAGRVTKRYPAPYYFYVQDDEGDYSDIYGNTLSRVDFDSWNSFKEGRERYRNMRVKLYESDISIDQKVLAENYYGKQATTESHISFFDIEVDYDRQQGFSSPQNPYAPVSAISLFHFWNKKSYMLLLSPHLSKWEPGPEWNVDMLSPETRALADIRFFDSEEELLLAFFELIEDTDVIAGWNSEGFDVPYIYERCLRLFGDKAKTLWCFPEAREPRYKEVEGKFGTVEQVLEIFGREHIDYLKAFQKFEAAMRPSYSLEAITDEILPELKKLEYEGTLYSLYREDFEHFVRYGIRDSECLEGFENKLGYIRLAIQMTRGSTTHLKSVMGTLKVVECAIVNFCHRVLDKKVPDANKDNVFEGKFTGAAVLKPRRGMHERVAALDVNSLYPSAIRTVNISPEKIIGQFFENHRAYEAIYAKSGEELHLRTEDGEVEVRTAAEWYDYFRAMNYTISGYGTVFNQDSQGFLPTILAEWYKLRKEYQAEAKAWKAKMGTVDKKSAEYAEYLTKHEYFYRLQYVYKILLNSSYGALGNQHFKFFDIRMAESTTRSGRAVLMHMIAYIAKIMDGTYAPPTEGVDEKGKQIFLPSSECTIYGDTDSCYFLTYADSLDEAKEVCKIVEKKTNDSFVPFVKEAFNSDNNVIKAGLDLISSRSIFIKPKMYIMHLDHFEDNDVDKMKVMGLQIKKTSIPKPIGTKLTKFIEALLKGEDWRTIQEGIVAYKEEILATTNVMDIGLPKGVTGIDDYTDDYKADPKCKLPGHVAASIFWNACLDAYGDKESLRITSGSKIKTFYLTEKFGRFKAIAVPTDTKKLPPWFKEHFEHLINYDDQGVRLIDNPLKHILGAIGERIPTRKTLLFDSLVEY